MENKIIRIRNWAWDPIKLELTDDLVWDSGKRNRSFEAKDLIVNDGVWIIKKGFQWNGTTAVPDGDPGADNDNIPVECSTGKIPVTWKASLIHDIGCEYTYNKKFPYSRKEIDRYFYKLLKDVNFKCSTLYYVGVRFFSIFLAYPFRWLGIPV